jgi:cytochrome c oxidase subunit 4
MSVEAHSEEHIRKHVRLYITVFVALAALTIITVGISYLHLPTMWAVLFALIVASIKGSLVACYFMHLISEKKIIYWVLGICAAFAVMLLLLPAATSGM